MAARRINLLNAAIELAFVLTALALGFVGASLWVVAALTISMMAYWFVSRRNQLEQLRGRGFGQLAGAFLLSLGLLFAVLAAAFWIGRALPGSLAP